MKRTHVLAGLIAAQVVCTASEPVTASVVPEASALGRIELSVPQWPANGVFDLPWDGRPLSAATLSTAPVQFVQSWELVQNGQRLRLNLRSSGPTRTSTQLSLELLSNASPLTDGRVQFPLATGKPETLSGASKSWSWSFTPTRPGTYTVEITAACAKASGDVVEFGASKEWAMGLVNSTGNKARFVQSSIGRLAVTDTHPQQLFLRLGEGERVKSEILAVTLRPTSESGRLLSQDSQGAVTLAAADVTLNGTHSTLDPVSKNRVQWVNESDALSWEFYMRQPGRFTAEVLFEPGTVTTGSEVELSVAGRSVKLRADGSQAPASLATEVQISAAGDQRLTLQFVHKAGTAPAVLREVRLSPKVADFAVKSEP